MVLIHIPRACPTITTDFVKEFFKEFSLVEDVLKSDNEHEGEVQFHVHVKEWNNTLQQLFQSGQARICYEDEGPRGSSYFICNLL
jgi:hypothetical protein